MGSIIGKLKMTIKVPLFRAFDAILETMVRVVENATEANPMFIKNKP